MFKTDSIIIWLLFIFNPIWGIEFIQNPMSLFKEPVSALTAAAGGIKTFNSNNVSNILKFTHSPTKGMGFYKSNIFYKGNKRDYFLMRWGIDDIPNTSSAWINTGSAPESNQIDYTQISEFDSKEITFLFTAPIPKYKIMIVPQISNATLNDASAFGLGLHVIKQFQFSEKLEVTTYVYDLISFRLWSTDRNEFYLPSLDIGITRRTENYLLGINLGSNLHELNYKFGVCWKLHEKFSIIGGSSTQNTFSIGASITINIGQLEIAYLSPQNNLPVENSQIYTLMLDLDKLGLGIKKLSP